MQERIDELVTSLAERLLEQGFMIAVAESCTGGWVSKVLTDLAGSSSWFDRGFITYSNEAKQEMLGVSALALGQCGAVSEAVVADMANGALTHSRAQVALAISGIAGPGGGTQEKPVGTVWFGWVRDGAVPITRSFCFDGDREQVRHQAVVVALEGVVDLLDH